MGHDLGITSFQSRRYQVPRKLGEGGKGIIFLCQDTTLKRRVAIKLIKGEVLDAEGLMRFQRIKSKKMVEKILALKEVLKA